MDGLVEGPYTQAAYKAQQRAVLLYAAFFTAGLYTRRHSSHGERPDNQAFHVYGKESTWQSQIVV